MRLEQQGDVLVVSVEERASIASIEVSGNKEIGKDDLLKGLKDIGMAQGRIFNDSLLDKVEQDLKRQYYNRGRYGVKVESKVNPLERNRVAVVIQITEGPTALIRQINLIGNKAFSSKELLKQFQLDTGNWLSVFTNSNQYSKQKLSADLESLRSFYLDRGYLRFEIKSTQVSISPDKQSIFIDATLSEGEPYRVKAVRLAGEFVVPKESLFPLVYIQRGDLFSRKQTTATTEKIGQYLGDHGYAFANVNTIPDIDEAEKQVSLTFFIDPGRRVYVRRIEMQGNTRTRDEVLRREMRQMEASWFSGEAIKRSRERLQRLGYFEDVAMETPAVAGAPDQVDIKVKVKEKPSGNLMAGIGYSQSRGVLLNASISENNFLGTGKRLALAFANNNVDTNYQIGYTNPYYTPDGISRGFNLSYTKTDFSTLNTANYATDTGAAGVNFGIPLTDTSRITLGTSYNYLNLKPGQSTTAQAYAQANEDVYNNFPFTASWQDDRRDRAILPTQGLVHTLSATVTIPGSDLEYYKLGYRLQWYLPLWGDYVFLFNTDLGYGDGYGSTKGLPFMENYFAGGPRTVRGFKEWTLGPKEEPSENPIGGNVKLVGGIEIGIPAPIEDFKKTMRISAFLDAGYVWQNNHQAIGVDKTKDLNLDLGDLRYSTGLSTTWYSPVGPLSFSLGFPLNAKSGDETQVFQFTLGQTF
ncbi:Outer membrane protein assembly factor BamA [Gammaproteobacteria bacterium]